MRADLLGNQTRSDFGILEIILVGNYSARIDECGSFVLQGFLQGYPDPHPLVEIIQLLLDGILHECPGTTLAGVFVPVRFSKVLMKWDITS